MNAFPHRARQLACCFLPGLVVGAAVCFLCWRFQASPEKVDDTTMIPVAASLITIEADTRPFRFEAVTLMEQVKKLLERNAPNQAYQLMQFAIYHPDSGVTRRRSACLDYLPSELRRVLEDWFASMGYFQNGHNIASSDDILEELAQLDGMSGYRNAQDRHILCGKLARIDPETARDWILSSAPTIERPRLLGMLFRTIRGDYDDWPARFARIVTSLPEGASVDWSGISSSDFALLASHLSEPGASSESGWQQLLDLAAPEIRARVESYASVVRMEDINEVVGTAESHGGIQFIDDWLRYHCGSDPLAILQAYREIADPNAEITSKFLRNLAACPGGDESIATLIDEGDLGVEGVNWALRILLATDDFDKAEAAARRYRERWPQYSDSIYVKLMTVAETPEMQEQVAAQIQDPERRKIAMAIALTNRAHEDPALAIEQAVTMAGENGWAQNRLVLPIFSRWLDADPYSASEWFSVQTQMMPTARLELLDRLIMKTMPYDPIAALAWIETIENPAIRQNFLENLANRLSP